MQKQAQNPVTIKKQNRKEKILCYRNKPKGQTEKKTNPMLPICHRVNESHLEGIFYKEPDFLNTEKGPCCKAHNRCRAHAHFAH